MHRVDKCHRNLTDVYNNLFHADTLEIRQPIELHVIYIYEQTHIKIGVNEKFTSFKRCTKKEKSINRQPIQMSC